MCGITRYKNIERRETENVDCMFFCLFLVYGFTMFEIIALEFIFAVGYVLSVAKLRLTG